MTESDNDNTKGEPVSPIGYASPEEMTLQQAVDLALMDMTPEQRKHIEMAADQAMADMRAFIIYMHTRMNAHGGWINEVTRGLQLAGVLEIEEGKGN